MICGFKECLICPEEQPAPSGGPIPLCAPVLAARRDPGSPDPLRGMWNGFYTVSNKEMSLR